MIAVRRRDEGEPPGLLLVSAGEDVGGAHVLAELPRQLTLEQPYDGVSAARGLETAQMESLALVFEEQGGHADPLC